MQGESGSSGSSHSTLQRMGNGNDFAVADDLGKFMGDASFGDVTSDDSSGWMHKIDVTSFQRLTSTSSIADPPGLQEQLPRSTIHAEGGTELRDVKMEPEEEAEDGQQWFGPATRVTVEYPPVSFSSHPYHIGGNFVEDGTVSPPKKRSRQRDASSTCRFNDNSRPHESLEQQQQISVVSSTTDASQHIPHRQYPKPVYSYSCMIALALKNSRIGRLQVAEIYCFMCENYPYFRTAPAGWKNSVRHNLSLNKCFEKIEVEAPGGHGRKCCLWTLNPLKAAKMDQEIRKYREKDPIGVREAYARPEDMELIEQGLKGMPNKLNIYNAGTAGKTMLPDIVQQASPNPKDIPEYNSPALIATDFGKTIGSTAAQAGAFVGKSELALKLLHQAASYRQQQWNHRTTSAQATLDVPSASAAAVWLPPQLENNRASLTPSLVDQCPLELPPLQYYGDRSFMTTPPCSTPIRQSTLAACSPFSYQHVDRSLRPPSLHRFQSQDLPHSSHQRQSPVSRDGCSIPDYVKHRTPERPSSCGYFGIPGGNNSLLVTPTSESQQQRRTMFGTPLDAAFCAATVHNNSLIMQSMQQFIGLEEQQEETYPLVFQPISSSPSTGQLHLTSL